MSHIQESVHIFLSLFGIKDISENLSEKNLVFTHILPSHFELLRVELFKLYSHYSTVLNQGTQVGIIVDPEFPLSSDELTFLTLLMAYSIESLQSDIMQPTSCYLLVETQQNLVRRTKKKLSHVQNIIFPDSITRNQYSRYLQLRFEACMCLLLLLSFPQTHVQTDEINITFQILAVIRQLINDELLVGLHSQTSKRVENFLLFRYLSQKDSTTAPSSTTRSAVTDTSAANTIPHQFVLPDPSQIITRLKWLSDLLVVMTNMFCVRNLAELEAISLSTLLFSLFSCDASLSTFSCTRQRVQTKQFKETSEAVPVQPAALLSHLSRVQALFLSSHIYSVASLLFALTSFMTFSFHFVQQITLQVNYALSSL